MDLKKISVSAKDLAGLLDISERRVNQLRSDGILTGEGSPAKYSLIDNVPDFIRFREQPEVNRTDAENESAKLEAEARMKQAKAQIAELELNELKGNLHRSEDVEEIMGAHIFAVKSMLMALPGRLAVDTAKAKTGPEAAEVVKKEAYRMLEDLSNFIYSKEEYIAKMRERQGWDEEEQEE